MYRTQDEFAKLEARAERAELQVKDLKEKFLQSKNPSIWKKILHPVLISSTLFGVIWLSYLFYSISEYLHAPSFVRSMVIITPNLLGLVGLISYMEVKYQMFSS